MVAESPPLEVSMREAVRTLECATTQHTTENNLTLASRCETGNGATQGEPYNVSTSRTAADFGAEADKLHNDDDVSSTATECDMVVYDWNELCVDDVGQPDRFKRDAPLRVYDTPSRKQIRDTLHAIASSVASHGISRIEAFVTGVGGNGKSHNLARFVMECRAKGNVVVYIHDLQSCLFDCNLFVREIKFALDRHAAAFPDTAIGDASITALMDTLLTTSMEPELLYLTTDDLISKLRDECTARGVKLVLVADQDNRVQAALSRSDANEPDQSAADRQVCGATDQNDRVATVDEAKFVNQLVIELPFDAVIVSASANNEAWVGAKQHWEQIIQYMEPVPLDVAAVLFPRAFNDPAVYNYVTEILGGYALGWQIGETVIKDFAATGEREVLKHIEATISGLVRTRLEKFMENDRRLSFQRVVWNASIESSSGACEYERNFWELRDGRILPMFPLAQAIAQARPTVQEMIGLESNRYEALFCRVVEGISTVGGRTRRTQLPKSYPANVLNHDSRGFADAVKFRYLQPCKKAQMVDFYGYHYDGKPDDTQIHTLYVFQLTLNHEHDDSVAAYFCEGQHYLKHPVTKLRKTLAKQNDDAIRVAFNLPDGTTTRVRFIWVTPHESVSLTRKGNISHTVRNASGCANRDGSLLDLLEIGNTFPTILGDPLISRHLPRPTELDNIIIEEYYWPINKELMEREFCVVAERIEQCVMESRPQKFC